MEIMQVLGLGMSEDAARLATTSMNVANLRTPGYKRQLTPGLDFAARLDALDGTAEARPDVAAEPILDVKPGALQYTRRSLDLAISGNDLFFEVDTPEGTRYTRQGALHLDAMGRLVTPQGYAVLGGSGEIRLQGGPLVIDKAGNIYEDGQFVDRLHLVAIKNPQSLRPVGASLYQAQPSAVAPMPSESAGAILQGYLESSNVDPAREMVNVVELMRHFESMQKVAQIVDDMTGNAIQKLSE